MCKFGDYFLYLDIDEDQGVTLCDRSAINDLERLEGEDKTNPLIMSNISGTQLA